MRVSFIMYVFAMGKLFVVSPVGAGMRVKAEWQRERERVCVCVTRGGFYNPNLSAACIGPWPARLGADL